MKGVFEIADVPYNLRNQSNCNSNIPCTERYGIETASSIGSKLWDKVSIEIKKFEIQFQFQIPTVLARHVNCSLNM